jgi:hypothetical protein
MANDAEQVRAEPGACWRMANREPGHQADTPADCQEAVAWIGSTIVSAQRLRVWSCQAHIEGLEDLHPVADV